MVVQTFWMELGNKLKKNIPKNKLLFLGINRDPNLQKFKLSQRIKV